MDGYLSVHMDTTWVPIHIGNPLAYALNTPECMITLIIMHWSPGFLLQFIQMDLPIEAKLASGT